MTAVPVRLAKKPSSQQLTTSRGSGRRNLPKCPQLEDQGTRNLETPGPGMYHAMHVHTPQNAYYQSDRTYYNALGPQVSARTL